MKSLPPRSISTRTPRPAAITMSPSPSTRRTARPSKNIRAGGKTLEEELAVQGRTARPSPSARPLPPSSARTTRPTPTSLSS
ncbi:MAG: hypothetical protein ACLR4Z_12820 [Butyricicoccaceae bacterium]